MVQDSPDRRYEADRRSDSLKRYKAMFDFLCPELPALQNNLSASDLRLVQIMISNTTACPDSKTGRGRQETGSQRPRHPGHFELLSETTFVK